MRERSLDSDGFIIDALMRIEARAASPLGLVDPAAALSEVRRLVLAIQEGSRWPEAVAIALRITSSVDEAQTDAEALLAELLTATRERFASDEEATSAEAALLLAMAQRSMDVTEFDRAIRHAQVALEVLRCHRDRPFEEEVLTALAEGFWSIGDTASGIRWMGERARILEGAGETQREAMVRSTIGRWAWEAGLPALAESSWRRAASLFEGASSSSGPSDLGGVEEIELARTLCGLSEAARARGDGSAEGRWAALASGALQRCLPRSLEGNDMRELWVLRELCGVAERSGEFDLALIAADLIGIVLRREGELAGHADAHLVRARLLMKAENPAGARRSLGRALEALGLQVDFFTTASEHRSLAIKAQKAGDGESALNEIRASLVACERGEFHHCGIISWLHQLTDAPADAPGDGLDFFSLWSDLNGLDEERLALLELLERTHALAEELSADDIAEIADLMSLTVDEAP